MSAPSASASPALAVERLNAWYGAAQVLYDVAFTVGRGEVVALMGRNGAGKSTTMKVVMGLLARRSGTVLLNGRDISALRPFEIARLGLSFPTSRSWKISTPDGSRRAPSPTARRPRRGRPRPCSGSLAEMRHRLGGRMCGGEQEMLTIARTLMGNPLVVLLDEPSEGIAPVIVEEIADTIVELKKRGLSILLSEQNVGFAEIVSDRAYMLEKGQIRWGGTMAELAENAEVQRSYLTL
jgi:branched-chain amino acid transport system ATP-binding protein